MSTTRTQDGIAEWSGRARRARTLEMRLADTIGAWVAAVHDPAAKAVLARHARHHAFHAELWDGVTTWTECHAFCKALATTSHCRRCSESSLRPVGVIR